MCLYVITDEEFLSIKRELVEDVLAQLRHLAKLEAELLFREYKNYPGSLPYFSERLSKAINRAKGFILNKLEHMKRGDDTYVALRPLFVDEHLPKKLASFAGDRVDEKIPLDYMRVAFASCLASKLLYREGINFLESQPEQKLPELALNYAKEERRILSLAERMSSGEAMANEADRLEVVRLLQAGGVRSSLQVY